MAGTAISKTACAIILGLTLCASGMARCETFPGLLLGKSVTVKWALHRQQRFESTGAVVSRTINASLQIYVSTAGRAFSQESVSFSGTGGLRGGPRPVGGAYQENRAPDDPESRRGVNVVHAEGRGLVVDRQMIDGARRVSITFDAGYGSCNARVIFGREGGAGALRGRSRVNGEPFEVLSSEVSTPSCSVRSGNVFGGE
jgi:hypothetical protein